MYNYRKIMRAEGEETGLHDMWRMILLVYRHTSTSLSSIFPIFSPFSSSVPPRRGFAASTVVSTCIHVVREGGTREK